MNKDEVISTFNIIAQSDAIHRYSRDRVLTPETVLQHTGWVALWVLLAGEDMESVAKIKLDWGTLMRRAVIHDLDEVGTGDVPRPTKYSSPAVADGLTDYGAKFLGWIETELGLSNGKIKGEWHSAKDYSPEGQLLKAADMAAVVYKVWDEILRQNNFAFSRVAYELKPLLLAICAGYEKRSVDLESYERWLWRFYHSAWQLIERALAVVETRKWVLGSIDIPMEGEE